MFKQLLKKLAGLRNKVQTGSKYDKRNVADEVRGGKAKIALLRYKRKFDQALGTQNSMIEFDLNEQASLEVGDLNFLAKAKNVFGNLITLSIIKDAVVVAATPEEQTISFGTVPDAGLWSVSLNSESITDLAHDANAATVQAALRLIEGLESVTVTGDYTIDFTVVFVGASGDQPLLIEETNTLETAAVPVVISIAQTVLGVAGSDTNSVIVSGSDIKIRCVAGATNDQVKAQIEASAPANSLISVTVDDGQGAVSATAALNEPFLGGA